MLQYFVVGDAVASTVMHSLYIFWTLFFFLSFNLCLHLYEIKTYSMVPLYIYFTLLWVPFSQLTIHNTITCVYTYVQFPQFGIFRAGFL